MPVGGLTVGQRAGAGWVLVAAWLLAVVGSVIGHPEHATAANLITAFLLWRIWRGVT